MLPLVNPDPQQAFYGVIFLVFAGVLGVALIGSSWSSRACWASP
jgi:hypothetical protein